MPDPIPPSFAPGQILTAADLNSGFAAVTPTTSGNLTPATAWAPVPALVGAGATAQNAQAQALLNRTEELNPDNQSPPSTLDGTESWSIRKAGTWAKASLSSIANFVLTIFVVVWVSGIGGVTRTLSAMLLDQPVSVKNFGVIGDGTTDDAPALQRAVNWLCGGNERRLIVNDGMIIRIASAITADFSGIARAGEFIMYGAIQPDAGIGRAITFLNMRGGRVYGRVYGGGQTADYTQADPTGGDEAFRFVNVYGTRMRVEGGNYAGRVLRVTSDSSRIGPDGFLTQWVVIESVYCNSIAKITDLEATRLAQGVGQAFYIDSGTNAFGSIEHAFMLWELYGSVIADTTDITFNDAETIYRGNTGMKLLGVISFWGGKLKLGSEKTGWTDDLLLIADGPDGRNSQNVQIDTVFAVGGANGVRAVNVGVTAGQGLTINNLETRLNTNEGLRLENCRKVMIAGQQYADNVGIHLVGACNDVELDIDTRSTKLQAGIVDVAVTGQVKFVGAAYDGNTNAAAATSLFDILTTASVFFNNFFASSGNVDVLYDMPSGNQTRITGGQVVVAGGAAIIGANQPNRATGVIGWQTSNKGTAVIASGTTSIVVNHGLVKAPDYIDLQAASAGGANAYPSSITATQFTINVPTAPGSNSTIYWKAEANYSG